MALAIRPNRSVEPVDTPPATAQVQAIIDGKYQVSHELGSGAMGTVMVAHDMYLDRKVAIKLAAESPDPRREAVFLKASQSESQAMARIGHPNVVTVFAAGTFQGRPFIVMEFVDGAPLTRLIEAQAAQARLPLEVAVGIASEIADGLSAVHAEGLIHRDVKPDNVIVTRQYRVKLVDFGVAQSVEAGFDLTGTPPYIAPEVIAGDPVSLGLRSRADIYALGVIAFQLLTGELPFVRPADARSLEDLLQAQINQEPLRVSMLRPDVPPEIDDAVARALAREPHERFSSCEELARALERGLRAQQRHDSGPVILVVDDDPTIRRMHSAVLKAAVPTADVLTADDGLVALKLAKARRPDLVLLDLNMPGVDGFELADSFASTDGLRDVPIVVVSGTLDQHSRERVSQLGVAEVLLKPLRPPEIAAVARRYLAAPRQAIG